MPQPHPEVRTPARIAYEAYVNYLGGRLNGKILPTYNALPNTERAAWGNIGREMIKQLEKEITTKVIAKIMAIEP